MKIEAIKRCLVILASVIILIPLVVLVIGSLGGKGIEDYFDILLNYKIGRNFLNSILITCTSVFFITAFVVLGAFSFSKIAFPFKNAIYMFVISALLLPGAAIMVPVFHVNKTLGLMNSYWSLIGPYIAMTAPFTLLIAKNYYDGLPDSLIEAGMLDGCSLHRALISIIIPISRPVIMIVIIWSFLSTWNEYLFAMIFLRKQEMMTVNVIPTQFQTMYGGNMPKLFASLLMIIVPVVVIYFILQKYIVEGITAGSVKG